MGTFAKPDFAYRDFPEFKGRRRFGGANSWLVGLPEKLNPSTHMDGKPVNRPLALN
jgi:hypothetical protein